MMVAVLHDLGVPAERFQSIAAAIRMHLEGTEHFRVYLEKVPCAGIQATFLRVELTENSHHRSVKTLETGLNAVCTELKLTPTAHQLATSIFSCILQAEGKIHNLQANDVHLHELASADTIFDAVGVAVGLESLHLLEPNVQVFVSDAAVGGGTVKIAHGTVPVPAPATAEIIALAGLVVKGGPIEKELLTPTGAAILASLKATTAKTLPRMKINKVGRGAGIYAKEGIVSPLTVYLGEIPSQQEGAEEVVLLETNIDDVPGEYVGHALERIQKAGALDAYISPALMKKSRPANVFHVLCKPADVPNLLPLIFAETGTLGVRVLHHYRICVPREVEIVRINVNGTDYEVHVKVAQLSPGIPGFKPEYEDLAKISQEQKVPVPSLAKQVIAEFLKKIPKKTEK